MSDEEVTVPSTFKKRNVRRKGGRKRKTSSSEEKVSSDGEDQIVVMPAKRPQKENPNIQSTGGQKKQRAEIDETCDKSSDEEKPQSRTTLSVQQQRENATATYDLDTERDRDAQAIFEKAQKINEELEGQADDKVQCNTKKHKDAIPGSICEPSKTVTVRIISPIRNSELKINKTLSNRVEQEKMFNKAETVIINRKKITRELLLEKNIYFKKRLLQMLEKEHKYNMEVARLKIKKLELEINLLENRKNKINQ